MAENSELWIWNKPSGWHTTSGKDKTTPNFEDFLSAQLKENIPESGLLHRLDQLTSGCLIAAKTAADYFHLKDEFRQSAAVHKVYWAVVSNECPPEGEFELFFRSRYKSSSKVQVSTEGDSFEKGRCRWKALEQSSEWQLLSVELIGPGRRHQIRAGFAFLGEALAGDVLYGGRESAFFGLHSREIRFQGLSARAPVPNSWPFRSSSSEESVSN